MRIYVYICVYIYIYINVITSYSRYSILEETCALPAKARHERSLSPARIADGMGTPTPTPDI